MAFAEEGANIRGYRRGRGRSPVARRPNRARRGASVCRYTLIWRRKLISSVPGRSTILELGDIHILVNNAGIHLSKSLLDTTEDDWEQVIRCQSARAASIDEAGSQTHGGPGHKWTGD